MDEHGAGEPGADAGAERRAVPRRVAGPLERPDGIERDGDAIATGEVVLA